MESCVNNSRKCAQKRRPICRFYLKGCCKFGNKCRFLHRRRNSLRRQSRLPVPNLNSSMGQKVCSICLDVVVEGETKKFGLLPNCNHCFCLACILKWRSSVDFNDSVTKACPECRTTSDFVFASVLWLKNEDKDKFISDCRNRMSKIDCRYFRKGKGVCLRGNSCLYLHAYPNGERAVDYDYAEDYFRSDSEGSSFFDNLMVYLEDGVQVEETLIQSFEDEDEDGDSEDSFEDDFYDDWEECFP